MLCRCRHRVCDGLKGLPDAINTTWEHTVVQQCIVHLIRNSFRYAGRQHRDAIVKSLKPLSHSPVRAGGEGSVRRVRGRVGRALPGDRAALEKQLGGVRAVPRIRRGDPARDLSPARGRYPHTNAIESINARYRRAVRARGHFPNEQAALKCLYLVTRSLDPTGGGRARWMIRWKPALNAFAITFQGRFEKTNQ
jgi:transposase-like protein